MSVLTLAAWLLASSLPIHRSSYFQQHTADRIFADSLVTVLHNASSVQALPTAACANRHDKFGRLCLGLVALRRAELTTDADDVRAADRAAQRMVAEYPRSAVAWYGLGIARLQLVQIHALAKDGPLQPIGVSNEAAAGYALIHALELDATLQVAGEALALAALPPVRERATRLRERVMALRQVRDILSPQALYGAGRIETIAGNADSAATDFRLALAHGTPDSGLVDLALARAEYKGGHSVAGHGAFLAGAADTSAAAVTAYREHVSWVASPDELATWDSLPSNARSAWLNDFWAKRDIAAGHENGARLAEHFARYETALTLYPLIIPETGVQRNAQDQDALFGDVAGAVRAAQHMGVSNDSNVNTMVSELQTFDAYSRHYGLSSPFRFVPQRQDLLDDRGVVYMRHGKPDQEASSAVEGIAMTIWRYNLPTGPLILEFKNQDFSGTVDASVLVPSLVTGNARTRDNICYLDPTICPLGTSLLDEISHGRMSPTRITMAYDAGMRSINQALTTDNKATRFTLPMHPVVQAYGLAHGTDAPRVLLSFALSGAELDADSSSTPSHVIYTVHLQASAENRSSGARFNDDTVRHFVTDHRLRRDEYLTGAVDLPVTAGRFATSLVVSQPTGRGAVAELSELRVPFANDLLTLSDIVLGRAGSTVQWNSGSAAVALNPLGTWPRESATTVYFQVAGLRPGAPYTTRYEIFGADDKADRPPRVSVSVPQTAAEDGIEVTRTLALRNLEPGRYRLVVVVTGNGASATGTGWITIVR